MSASESSPLTTNLQESIEHLIAETVRRSKDDHEKEQTQLRGALQQALSEVEAGQAAMIRAATILREALETPAPAEAPTEAIADLVENATSIADTPPTTGPAESKSDETTETSTDADAGPRDLDVVAHNINFRIASSLQKWLNERAEVQRARTRSYVDSELHLELNIERSISKEDLTSWLAEHNGTIATHTASVLELRFEN